MKILAFIRNSNTQGNPPVMCFAIQPQFGEPDWLDAGAHLSQQVTRDAIGSVRKMVDEAEAKLDEWEREKAIREEIEARLAS